MKIKYFDDTDTLYIELKDREIAETRDLDENATVDVDAEGNLLAIMLRRGLIRGAHRGLARNPRPWRRARRQEVGEHHRAGSAGRTIQERCQARGGCSERAERRSAAEARVMIDEGMAARPQRSAAIPPAPYLPYTSSYSVPTICLSVPSSAIAMS
jgi:hypothetical protein